MTLALEQAAAHEDWEQFNALLNERETVLSEQVQSISASDLALISDSNQRVVRSLRTEQTKMAEEFRTASSAIRARGQYRAASQSSVAVEI